MGELELEACRRLGGQIKMKPSTLSSGTTRRSKTVIRKFLDILKREDEGGALVEMAVTLPIVMVIMTGVFSFSIALYQKLQLAEAVSVGGRQLAVSRGQTDPCTITTSAINTSAPGLIPTTGTNGIKLTYILNGTSTTAGTSNGAGVTACSGKDLTAGSYAQITATYPCSLSVYGMSFTSCSLGTQITEVIQ